MSNFDEIQRQLQQDIFDLPIFDCHSHVDTHHLAARGLHDVLLYHMVVSDFYSAGCPEGERVSETPDDTEIVMRVEQALPFLDKIQNTSCAWGVRIILEDLYDWHEPITKSNWHKLHARIARRSESASWPRKILRLSGVTRGITDWYRRGGKCAEEIYDYALEWSFFARKQWDQNDIPIYELECAWQVNEPNPALSVTLRNRPPVEKCIRTIEDVHLAMDHYCERIPFDQVVTTAQHFSTDIEYQRISDEQMASAIKNRGNATTAERDIYASYLMDAFLTRLERNGDKILFQFSLGAESLPYETGSQLTQKTIGQLGDIIARFPRLQFQCMLASRHGNQSLCTLARELPNLSLAGYWWHNFFPDVIRQVCSERLDMLPLNKQVGFFSDAYCVDWIYAKTKIVRSLLAEVLTERICRKQYSYDQALFIAGYILKDSAEALLAINSEKSQTVGTDIYTLDMNFHGRATSKSKPANRL